MRYNFIDNNKEQKAEWPEFANNRKQFISILADKFRLLVTKRNKIKEHNKKSKPSIDKKTAVIVSALVSAAMTVSLTFGKEYLWEHQRSKAAALAIHNDILVHLITLEGSLQDDKSMYINFNMRDGNRNIILQNYFIPDRGLYILSDQNLFTHFLSESKLTSQRSIVLITQYYRVAAAMKDRLEEIHKKISSVLLATNGNENKFNSLELATILINYYSVKVGIFTTLETGFQALASINKDILGDYSDAEKYSKQSKLYGELKISEGAKINQAKKKYNDIALKHIESKFNTLPETVKDNLLEIGKEYSKQRASNP